MRTILRTAPLTFVVALLVGCAGGTTDAGSQPTALPGVPSSSSAASSASTRTATAGDVPPPPKVGQCRNTPERNLGRDDWVDQSPVVACSRPPTLETVGVIRPAMKLTLALAKQLAPSCESPALSYLGISFRAVRTLALPVVYWPSRAQRAAGQTWLRCDVGVKEPTYCCGHLVPQTRSMRGAVLSDPVRFQMCLNQLPTPTREQPLTSCKKPHRTEVLPTLLEINAAHYPSAAVLSRKGRSGCADLIADRKDRGSLVVTHSWPDRASWSGGTLYGYCWIHRTTGLIPPVR
jgi:hypothetical protein